MEQPSHRQNQSDKLHVPVLLGPVLQYLAPKAGDSYLDLTAGYGGHAKRIIDATQAPDKAVLVDRDSNAIRELERAFTGQPVEILHTDFLQASQAQIRKSFTGTTSPARSKDRRGFVVVWRSPKRSLKINRLAVGLGLIPRGEVGWCARGFA